MCCMWCWILLVMYERNLRFALFKSFRYGSMISTYYVCWSGIPKWQNKIFWICSQLSLFQIKNQFYLAKLKNEKARKWYSDFIIAMIKKFCLLSLAFVKINILTVVDCNVWPFQNYMHDFAEYVKMFTFMGHFWLVIL